MLSDHDRRNIAQVLEERAVQAAGSERQLAQLGQADLAHEAAELRIYLRRLAADVVA